jgi:uncharacterized protein (DUF488 family)
VGRPAVYSIGSSNRSFPEFLEVLCHYGIEIVADVRRFPTSRFPHFTHERLRLLLEERGIEYLYLGDSLGGYRSEGYGQFTETPDYKDGLKHLEELGKEKVLAFVCAERLPWKCHRRFIGRDLTKRGWDVFHILERDRIWTPKDEDDQQSLPL